MNRTTLLTSGAVAAVIVAVSSVVVAFLWGAPLAIGMLVGGAWHLASLWCLASLLAAWLGPQRSQRTVLGWLLVKFPLLYGAAILLLRHPSMSIAGFALGFTVVLVAVIAGVARGLPRMMPSNGR